MNAKRKQKLNGKPAVIKLVMNRPTLHAAPATLADLKMILGDKAKVKPSSFRGNKKEVRVTLMATQKNMSLIGPALNRSGWLVTSAKL